MSKRKSIIQQEMCSLLPYYLVINAVYFAVLLALFFWTGFDYTLLTGGVYGNAVCVLNFWLLGVSAEKAVLKSEKAANSYMRAMYGVRYLGMFLLLSIAALLPCFNIIAALVPLLFARIAITIRAFREKDN